MIIACLTGGIATGKSTVASIFKELGAVIVDADKIAHDVVKKDLPAWQSVVAHFGNDILLPDGEINREKLGDIVFKDAQKKNELNRIVHPHVITEMTNQVNRIIGEEPDCVLILDVPLLMEIGMHKKFSDVILVYIPEYLQLERLMKRNNLSEEDALARIRSQMPIEEKKELADIIIDNSSSIEDTKKWTIEVYTYLKNKV